MTARCNSMWLTLVFTCLACVSTLAQTTGGTLQGTIADAQGGVLPGASITIRNTDTGWTREVVSDERGWYRVAALPAGPLESMSRCPVSSSISDRPRAQYRAEATSITPSRLPPCPRRLPSTGITAGRDHHNTLSKTITRTELDTRR